MTQPNELVERRFEELQEKAAQQAVMAAHWKLRHEKSEAEDNTLREQLERVKEGLNLAANRLARCALEPEHGSHNYYEWQEWANEARSLLSDMSKMDRLEVGADRALVSDQARSGLDPSGFDHGEEG